MLSRRPETLVSEPHFYVHLIREVPNALVSGAPGSSGAAQPVPVVQREPAARRLDRRGATRRDEEQELWSLEVELINTAHNDQRRNQRLWCEA